MQQSNVVDNSTTIKNLLEQLRSETVQANKKKLRRALRALGHRGGLRTTKPAEVVVIEPEIAIEMPEPAVSISRGSAESKKKRGK